MKVSIISVIYFGCSGNFSFEFPSSDLCVFCDIYVPIALKMN